MPNRTLKESIRESESINMLSHAAECTWFRLITYVDDYGLFKANARLINRALFPLRDYSDEEVAEWLEEIAAAGMIEFYLGEDQKPYGRIVNWTSFNTPRNNKPKYPQPKADSDIYTSLHSIENICTQLHANENKCARSSSSTRSRSSSSYTRRTSPGGEGDQKDKPTEKKKDPPDPETWKQAEGLASSLLEFIQANNPDFVTPTDSAFSKWTQEIDRMIRIDKRAPDRIQEMITWAQCDDFWKFTILSGASLRKHANKIVAKMNSGRHPPNGNGRQYEGLSPKMRHNVAAAEAFINGADDG